MTVLLLLILVPIVLLVLPSLLILALPLFGLIVIVASALQPMPHLARRRRDE